MKLVLSALVVAVSLLAGCTPGYTQPTHTRVLAPDQEDNMGGSFIESSDIRTVASKMCPEILSVPEIAGSAGITRIAIHPVRNSTRHVFDKNIFAKRLRIELNRYGGGRVRFIDPNAAGATTARIMRERDGEEWEDAANAVADYIVNSKLVQNSPKSLRLAMLPVKNANIVDMTGDGFAMMLRAKIAEKAEGKITFLASVTPAKKDEDGEVIGVDPMKEYPNADYFLMGEFFAQSVKAERLELVEGLYVVSHENGNSRDVNINVNTDGGAQPGEGGKNTGSGAGIQTVYEKKDSPNVSKYLNVMLVERNSNQAMLEKLVKVEKELKTGLAKAELVLTGEISSLSKSSSGDRSDYVIMSFQLINPDGNEVIWEGVHETKRVTDVNVVYK